jgi:PadR family transcriptional regulator, regulatory protein PadR
MEPIRRVTAPTLDVLDALLAADGPAWGLLVIKRTGRLAGTVYPILERLERQGWVTSSWDEDSERSGPRRRLYEFSGEGRAAAEDLVHAAAAWPARTTAVSTRRPVTS